MDVLIQNGLDWIIAIQSLGSWLELPMEFLTFLGNENFFFLVLPLIYWSVDTGLGLRVAFILSTSNYINALVKLLFLAPRPYWHHSSWYAPALGMGCSLRACIPDWIFTPLSRNAFCA
jgi:hypothetical protein